MSKLNYPDITATRNRTVALEVVTDGVEYGGGQYKFDFASGDVGTPATDTTAVEHGNEFFHQTVLTMTDVSLTAGNTTGVSFGGTKVYDFPEGRIHILGSTLANVTIDLTDAGNATPIDGDDNGDIAMGTTVAGDGTLTATDVDLIPSTALAFDTAITGVPLAAAAVFDGTTTAVDAYFNMIIDDADVGDGASDVLLVSGVWTVTWANLGDY